MLNRYARAFFTKVFTPVARLFLKLGISPDVVTVVGTLGVCFGALAFYPRGGSNFFWGTLVITAFVFSDTIDGVMARMSGRSGQWGAYLDSTLDRVGDSAIFGGLVLWFAGGGDDFLDGRARAGLPDPRAAWCPTPRPAPRGSASRPTSASPSGPTGSSPSWSPPDWSAWGCPRSCSPSSWPCWRSPAWSRWCSACCTVRRQALAQAS